MRRIDKSAVVPTIFMSVLTLGTLLSPAMAVSSSNTTPIIVAQNETSIAAVPYLWAAERDAAGKIHLTGYAPTAKIKRYIAILSGETADDKTQIADGAPYGFSDAAATAIILLKQVTEGRVSYNGKEWSLIASVADAQTKQNALAALDDAEMAKNWRIVLQVSEAAVATITPEAAPVKVEAETTPEVVAEAPAKAEPAAPAEEGKPAAKIASEDAVAIDTEMSPATDAAVDTLKAPAEDASTSVVTSELEAVQAEEPSAPATASEPTDVNESTELVDNTAQAPEIKYLFNARKALDGSISMFGVVPQASAKFYLSGIAGMAATDTLYVSDGAPAGFLANAAGGLRALQDLSEGMLSHEFSNWKLEGVARTALQKEKLEQRIANLSNAAAWRTEISVTPPIKICREHVEHLAKANAILFGSGSARLVTSSTTAIDQLAVFLEECPDAIVHVEGHTDADGSDEKNLALSVARAEAVIAELITRGVREERLYAVGYGESQPIASNDTNDGKRQNRRIVFKVSDENR